MSLTVTPAVHRSNNVSEQDLAGLFSSGSKTKSICTQVPRANLRNDSRYNMNKANSGDCFNASTTGGKKLIDDDEKELKPQDDIPHKILDVRILHHNLSSLVVSWVVTLSNPRPSLSSFDSVNKSSTSSAEIISQLSNVSGKVPSAATADFYVVFLCLLGAAGSLTPPPGFQQVSHSPKAPCTQG